MVRRYIKKASVNDEGQITPEITAVISRGDNLQSSNEDQKFFSRNYLDALKKVIPDIYFRDDKAISGTHVNYINQLVNSYCLVLKNIETILPVSSLTSDTYLSSISTPTGFSRYFTKQNEPNRITSEQFERFILAPLGQRYDSYPTSSAFLEYISGTFLPSIPVTGFTDLATLTTSSFASDSSGTYKFLTNTLGWLFFLNREAPAGGNFDPSTAVAETMVTNLWYGKSIELEDSLNIFQEYLWRNDSHFGVSDRIIPIDFVSSAPLELNTNTSGIQLLQKLQGVNSILYSPLSLDSEDTFVRDSIGNYLNTSTLSQEGSLITDEESNGPLARFLEAISFSITDRLTEANELGMLYDIGKCPDEMLRPLADLIGWKLLGADTNKWRVQLRNAVTIYKQKGTKNSIQLLLNCLFSDDVFNITDEKLFELWESYLPDLIYYSLATSSTLFTDFKTYTPEVSRNLGIATYSQTSMDRNIKYAVDHILFELVRKFPENFFLGGRPFPAPTFYLSGTDRPYEGSWHLMRDNTYMTEAMHTENSKPIVLRYDPDFTFFYRDREYWIPPYEKRQYYTQSYLSRNLLSKLAELLSCFGVDSNFNNELIKYVKDYTVATTDTARILNTFLILSKSQTYPPNYSTVIKNTTKEKTPDPLSLLSMWNGKSSHFLVLLDSSSFDWKSREFNSESPYGLRQVFSVMNEVVPAHAIPEVILTVSALEDEHPITDLECREVRPNFYDLYTGSGDVTNNFASKAVDMEALATANGITPHKFLRHDVDNINDVLLSGTTFCTVPRNTLRRRNYRHLLPETKMFTRLGRNNPGSLELSSSYYSSSIGYIPLGFVPSSLDFTGVALRDNTFNYGIGTLIDYKNLNPIWDICQNLTSVSAMFGYQVSNTFASRAKQNLTSSDCNTYGRRGQLPEILWLMNSTHDRTKYLQASSMVSGYFNRDGTVDNSISSNSLISPVNFSSWYANTPNPDSVVKSISNYLINQESDDEHLRYYENFGFGLNLHRLYGTYLSTYGQHGTMSNYTLLGGPNMFSHTYGPLIYNNDFEVEGSAIAVSSFLQSSSTLLETDISFYGGSGVLSEAGFGLGTYGASTTADLYVNNKEFRNPAIVSSIELVDTSSSTRFAQHPIFSVFRVSKNDLETYAYNSYLLDNTIIKYHKSTDPTRFPRIRIPIDNSDNNNKARNFLEPNHEYEVQIRAHNLDIDSINVGGLHLGMWVHTQSEDGSCWNYRHTGNKCGTTDDKWYQHRSDSFGKPGGSNIVRTYTQDEKFRSFTLNEAPGVGEGTLGLGSSECEEVIDEANILPGTNPRAVANLSDRTRQVFTFPLTTYNNMDIPNEYRQSRGDVHRLDQKYVLEFYVPVGDPTKFVVFEEIKLVDLTNKNNAIITTDYGNIPLVEEETRTAFRYFNGLREGNASRNSTITSGTMEVSGGSRLNYRSNIQMYVNSEASNGQLETIDIEDS